MTTSTIYSKVQTKFAAAFIGALADAVTSFIIFYQAVGDGAYNVATSAFTPESAVNPPTTVAGVAKTDGSCRGILEDEKEDSDEDNVQFNYKIQSLLVLDSELNSLAFDFDNNKYFVTIATVNYEVVSAPKDPAGATFQLKIKKVQA